MKDDNHVVLKLHDLEGTKKKIHESTDEQLAHIFHDLLSMAAVVQVAGVEALKEMATRASLKHLTEGVKEVSEEELAKMPVVGHA